MSQPFGRTRRRRAACRCSGLNAVTKCRMVVIELIVPRVFGLSLATMFAYRITAP